MNESSGIATVNGTRLYYEAAGTGEPLVFVHGLALDTRMWDDQFDEFAKQYRVVRYDVRGFGKSALPSEAQFRHADDLRALLTFLGIARAHVVGLSMGGRIALQYVLLYPEEANSLTLVDAALDGHEWSEQWDASLDAISERAVEVGPEAANRMWLEHELFAPAREDVGCRAKLSQIAGEYSGWSWSNDSPAVGLDPPASQRLHEIKVPTLVVVGERDLPDFQQIAHILARGIPGARKIMMKDVGHMSNMENPSQFNSVLSTFLDTTRLARPT